MPEAVVVEQPVTTTQVTESLGWRAGLPDDLKQNQDLAAYKTVGDFAKDAIATRTKVTELEGKLANAVPKLPDNATDEDRANYLNALGRPKAASEYQFDGEDKNAPEWTNYWKDQFHGLGLTTVQAKTLSGLWNGQMQRMVEAHNNAIKQESATAETKLRSELGDKYDTNVELAKRVWQKHGDSEFDKVFADAPPHIRFATTKLLLKMAALTGEDTSPQAGISQNKVVPMGFDYSKSPKPPVR